MALANYTWIRDITGALSIPVLIQYLELRCWLDDNVLQSGTMDRLIWKWTAMGQFSMLSAYGAMFLGQTTVTGASTLWKSRAPSKCRFFLWIILLG
jgi:hypothetical protein